MQGNAKIIALLNKALNSAGLAEKQFWLQSHVVREQGFGKLADKLKKISREIHHQLHQFSDRVLFLEGTVDLGSVTVPPMAPGASIETIIADDLALMESFIGEYTDAQNAAMAVDPTTAKLFRKFLEDNEDVADWFEKQVDLIASLGLALYLQTKVG